MSAPTNTPLQQVIEGVLPPPPPKLDHAFVYKTAKAHIEKNGLWDDVPTEKSASDIADAWHPYVDAYQMAKDLDEKHGWSIGKDDVDELDSLLSVIYQAANQARKDWAQEWNIQPPFPVGTRVKYRFLRGVIAGVSEHHGATYEVKKNGCRAEGRFRLLTFENVELDVEGGAA